MMKVRNDKKHLKKGTIWMTMGLLLIAAAFLLMAYNLLDDRRAEKEALQVMEALADVVEDAGSTDSAGYPTDGITDMPEELPDYKRFPDMEMPTVMVEGNAYIGYLDIPAIDLFLPVMSSWSYAKLKIAPCRYGGSAYTGDLVIAAHNYRSHFGSLRYLNTGDQVIFTDVDGNQFVYSVGEVEILAPAAVEEMLDSGWDLTLFTCTYGGRTRLAIRCELE